MKDPWLHSPQDRYIYFMNEALIQQNVSSLMHSHDGSWDKDLILDIFDDRDASIILSIPLNIEEEDSWYWRHEKFGRYSVKSAYALIQDGKPNNNVQDNSGFWRCLLNLKISPKIKNSVACKF